jgi:D-alanyl-D-alanine carboxypeptidase
LLVCLLVSGSLWGSPQDFRRHAEGIADPELLLLVNKTRRLDSTYIPLDLVDLTGMVPAFRPGIRVRKIVLNDLTEMIAAAGLDHAKLRVMSGYRSFGLQRDVHDSWIRKLGEREANRVSAVPGASQHQLGTAIDFNSLDPAFEHTPEGQWLKEHADRYGFVIAYPKDMERVTGYQYEPWHARYIGTDAAYLVRYYFGGDLERFLNWFEGYRIHHDALVVPRSAAIGASWPTFERFSTINP